MIWLEAIAIYWRAETGFVPWWIMASLPPDACWRVKHLTQTGANRIINDDAPTLERYLTRETSRSK